MFDYKEPPKELQDKKYNSTKFKQCGWCEYASGTHRYQYCIEGKCSLLKSYSKEIKWNTECLLNNVSKNEIESFVDYHNYEIRNCESSILRHKEYIDILNKIGSKSKYLPPLPDNRKAEHFNIDDEIAVFVEEENKWYFGEVKNGYRHHDGCVSYRLNGKYNQEGNDTSFPYVGGYPGCGVAIPYVMLKSEYDWFKENLKEYDVWYKKSYNKDFNGKKLKIAELNN